MREGDETTEGEGRIDEKEEESFKKKKNRWIRRRYYLGFHWEVGVAIFASGVRAGERLGEMLKMWGRGIGNQKENLGEKVCHKNFEVCDTVYDTQKIKSVKFSHLMTLT